VADTFQNQISANKRNSFLLTLLIVILFALLGFSIGYAIGGEVTSAIFVMVIALVVGGLLSVGSFFSGDSLSSGTLKRARTSSIFASSSCSVISPFSSRIVRSADVVISKYCSFEYCSPRSSAARRSSSVHITLFL